MKSFFTTFAILAAAICQAQAQIYTITDLGSLGGGYTAASGINNSGQVSGETTTVNGDYEGFIYSGGVLAAIPNVTLPGGASGVFYEATAINASGQAAGYSGYGLSGVGQYQAFLYSGGVSNAVSTIDIANGIDNAGDVVGYGFTGEGARVAYLNSNGTVTNLGNLGGNSDNSYTVANGINNEGQIVGGSDLASSANHAFIWTASGGMVDLGTLGGLDSIAWAINDNGQVVGSASTASGDSDAFLWSSASGMIDLGTLGGSTSRANALNINGDVVGESRTASGDEDAFIYEGGQLFDLNNLVAPNSGYVLNDATGINDSGQIVVDALDTSNGDSDALLLTPSAAPEPSSCFLFGLSALVLLISYRRKAKVALR